MSCFKRRPKYSQLPATNVPDGASGSSKTSLGSTIVKLIVLDDDEESKVAVETIGSAEPLFAKLFSDDGAKYPVSTKLKTSLAFMTLSKASATFVPRAKLVVKLLTAAPTDPVGKVQKYICEPKNVMTLDCVTKNGEGKAIEKLKLVVTSTIVRLNMSVAVSPGVRRNGLIVVSETDADNTEELTEGDAI